MKICNTCRESKSLNEFYKDKASKDGKAYKCKVCSKLKANKWSNNNSERHKEIAKKWISNNHERHKETIDKWIKNNPELHKENNKKYQQKHRSILENRLKTSIRTQYYNVIPKEYRHDIIKVLGCSIKDFITYLEKQFDEKMNWENYGKYWEIDHIYPKSKGGIYHYSNTQPLSIKENRIKYNIICNNQKPIVY